MKYLVVIEKADGNWAAYSLDVPGCIATGQTPEEARQEYRQALQFHLEGLSRDGLPAPEPNARADYVEVAG